MFSLFVPRLNADELAQELRSANPPRLLDVREPEEVEVSMIEGALHIPLGELKDRIHELSANEKWVVYCRSGARSASAVRFLAKSGFKDVRNLDGGLLSYAERVAPEMPVA